MNFLFRLLMLGFMTAAAASMAKPANKLFDQAIETVKALVTTYELSHISNFIQSEFEAAGKIPRPGDSYDLTSFIHQFMQVKDKARDPAKDMWGKPYKFDVGHKENLYVLYSTGPNKKQDTCRDQDKYGDDICAWIFLKRTDSPFRSMDELR